MSLENTLSSPCRNTEMGIEYYQSKNGWCLKGKVEDQQDGSLVMAFAPKPEFDS